MRKPVRALAIVLVGIGLSACAAAIGTGARPNPQQDSPTGSPTLRAGPAINWDHPLRQPVSADVSSVMDGQTRFGLIFQPAIPQFNAKLLTVDVNDPSFWPPQGRGVGFVYDFAGDTRFSGDARVFVGEEPAESNEEANLKQMAHSLPLASVTSIEGRSVTLLQSDGVGRTLWVWENVEYTIAGPAVPPAVVMDLTRQFISQG